MADPHRAGSIADAPWLGWSSTRAVIAALGPEHCRFVGGAVRDQLLGLAVNDIDIATTLRPGEVIARAEAAGLKAVPTGVGHGTVTVVANHQPFEVTTLRLDLEGHGRHATVAFTDNWRLDAARRDFTINALYADAEGQIADYWGGLDDLAEGRVRFIGDPAERIAEDGLRILRFFRFTARFGKDAADPAGLAACRDQMTMLDHVSMERVATELRGLLATDAPSTMVSQMAQLGVFDHLFAQTVEPSRLHRLVEIERAADVRDPARRFMALFDGAEDRVAAARRLKLSRAQQTRMAEPVLQDDQPLTHQVYYFGKERVLDGLILRGAEGAEAIAAVVHNIKLVESFQTPQLPIKGKDLIAAGVPEGPALGQKLQQLEKRWVDSDFTLDRSALLSLAPE